MLKKISLNPKQLFLIDGFGAVISAVCYFLVLANFERFFGLPQREVYYLGFLAIIYAAYSFICYIKDLEHWQPFMKVIAMANLLHCFITIGLVIYYYQQITIWGMLYFIGELIIVIPLATLELKTSSGESQLV